MSEVVKANYVHKLVGQLLNKIQYEGLTLDDREIADDVEYIQECFGLIEKDLFALNPFIDVNEFKFNIYDCEIGFRQVMCRIVDKIAYDKKYKVKLEKEIRYHITAAITNMKIDLAYYSSMITNAFLTIINELEQKHDEEFIHELKVELLDTCNGKTIKLSITNEKYPLEMKFKLPIEKEEG